MYRRELLDILKNTCFSGKVIILLGPRQVGKTTLLKKLIQKVNQPSVWFNADEGDVFDAFVSARTSTQLRQLIGTHKLVIIDEAQQIPEIGKKLKLLFDNYPEIQVIASGSSAFELQNETNEPLTGRKMTFHLFPLSFQETIDEFGFPDAKRLLDTRLIYGSYPDVVKNPGKEKAILTEIANSYLYKDILKLDNIRKSSHINKLLQALAFQVGSEVSFYELSQIVGNINTETVERYIDLFEKAFIIFKLPALSRNVRNELKKGKKYYFYDNGIRNVLMSNFMQPDLRLDKGAMWENFLLAERMRRNSYDANYCNTYFWRTHAKQEIDYLEENAGVLNAYEIKWKDKKVRFPNAFLEAYPQNTTKVISRTNYEEFILSNRDEE